MRRPSLRRLTVEIFSTMIWERHLSPFSGSGWTDTRLGDTISVSLVKGQIVMESTCPINLS